LKGSKYSKRYKIPSHCPRIFARLWNLCTLRTNCTKRKEIWPRWPMAAVRIVRRESVSVDHSEWSLFSFRDERSLTLVISVFDDMELGLSNTVLASDQRLIDHIVGEVKSQGIFDQFRKECIADVDTKVILVADSWWRISS